MTEWIASWLPDLPPIVKLLAVLVPIVAFVSWGPWAWTFGAVAAWWAGGQFGGGAALVAAALGGATGYVLNCRWRPYANCWWCKGTPKRRDQRTHFHFCFVCKGNGRRTRLGAYAYSKYRDKD